MNKAHYGRLLLMAGLSFISMYVLMYAMVDTTANVYLNFNQAYMAGLMTAPMVIIELVLIIGVSAVALGGLWMLIRQQPAIGNVQFLRSMIPYHAGAILMSERAPGADDEIEAPCKSILASQRSEIDQMKATLSELGR
jgi:hypothetical protein